jgi:hypothetical protein
MKRTSLSPLALACLVLTGVACSTPADAGVTVTVDGNTARARIELGGSPGAPQYAGTLLLTFDSPVGLSAQNLDITAQVVNPDDPALRARLPSQATVPGQFPVLVSVRPRNGFEFRNAAQVELYTQQLAYAAGSPYRLYKAPAGGTFHDLTEDVLAGSVRCRGRTGGFSDFLIVADTGAARDAAADKFAFLDARVDDEEIDDATAAQLQLDLDEAYEEFLEGDYEDAREELDDLELAVDAGAGSTVPNRWRAQGDLDNVAGSLEGEAAALDFYLRQLVAAGTGSGAVSPGGGDDDGDDDDGADDGDD